MKVVIAGSASLQDEIQRWIHYWDSKEGYSVLDYPQGIPQDNFEDLYPEVHINFFKHITEADVLFLLQMIGRKKLMAISVQRLSQNWDSAWLKI